MVPVAARDDVALQAFPSTVHCVLDEAVAPFGGSLDSGNGARFGGSANLDAFTETRWITLRGEIPQYPF